MLPRAARLRSGREFRATYSRSQSYATPRLVLYLRSGRGPAVPWQQAPKQPGTMRVGFSIGKKAARKAHERNLIKRRLREIVRLRVLGRVKPGRFDAVIVARSPAVEAAYRQLAEDIEHLFNKAGAFELS